MAKRNTVKKNEAATMLHDLFGVAVADLKKLESAERDGLAAVAAFGASSENLLRAILPKTEEAWVFPEDLKPYEVVRDSIVRYAHETGDKAFKIEGSIADHCYPTGMWTERSLRYAKRPANYRVYYPVFCCSRISPLRRHR